MTDYKFDIDGKQLSSEEINAKKDFDSFMKGVKTKGKPLYQKGWFWASTGLASLVIASMFFVNNNDSNPVKLQGISANKVTTEETPFINPPFKALSVEGDVFKVDANKGGIFKNRHGSILKIPAFAFLSRKGKRIKNQIVDVKFTEYKDVADQIISGIPMEYDSAGTRYMFSSAGMVEVRGFIGDSAVNLDSEKPIEVEMKSSFKSTEYNFYCLNEKDKKWDYLGKDSVGQSDNGKLSDDELKAKIPSVKKSDIVIPDHLVDAELQKTPEYKRRKRKRIQIQAELDELSKATPAKPIKGDVNAQKFSLDILETENPELVPYKDVQFQLAPGQNINPTHTQQNWNNVDLEKGEDNQVVITFSKTNSRQKVKYNVIPVLEGNAFEKAHNAYEAHLNKIGGKRKELRSAEKQIKLLKKGLKNAKVDKEFALEQLKMAEKLAAARASHLQNAKSQQMVTRYFKVAQFGIFNSDKAQNMLVNAERKIHKIDFKGAKGLMKTYDVFPGENGVYSQHVSIGSFYKDFKNEKASIGIRAGKLGILESKSLEDGALSYNVKGIPKSKKELKKWLDI